jgi:hypothetical protein
MYTRESLSCDTFLVSAKYIGFERILLAWLYRWIEISTIEKYVMLFISIEHTFSIHSDSGPSIDLTIKTSISSVLGGRYTELTNDDETRLGNGNITEGIDRMLEILTDTSDESTDDDDDDDKYHYRHDENADQSAEDVIKIDYSPFCEKVTRRKDLPPSLFAGENTCVI